MLFGLGKKSPEDFWRWFMQNAENYYEFDADNKNSYQMLMALGRKIKSVDKNLAFELSSVENGKRKLIISADGVKSNIPSVNALVKAAPEINKWQIVAFRERKASEYVEYEGKRLKLKEIFFRTGETHDAKTDVEIYIAGWDDSEIMVTLSFLILDDTLGEYDVMMHIGEITWYDLNKADKNELLPISEIPKLIDSNK